jgi:hypothetical protein
MATELKDARFWTTSENVYFLINNPLVTQLYLSHIDFRGRFNDLTSIFDAISNRPITKLDFNSCNLGNDEMKAITTGIASFTTLTFLSFYVNNIGHEGAMEIIRLISERRFKSLENLRFSDNPNIGDEAIQRLAKVMLESTTCKSVKTLWIHEMGITDGGVCAIAELINKCPLLEDLSFDWMPHTKHSSLVVFFRALSLNVTLQTFYCYTKGSSPL